MNEPVTHYFDLSHFALIRVSGNDAREFLQNQITANLDALGGQDWVMSAWCLPNGRIISNFILYSENDHYMLILPSMLKQKVMQRLFMFVLRSQVEITDASDDYALIGLHGSNINAVLNEFDLSFEDRKLVREDGITIINLAGEESRIILVIRMDRLGSRLNRILMACQQSDRNQWSLLDIRSGIPWITAPTSESFLPQMLNLDLTGGLSFDKGCYPGQEIVARLHYKSEAKKRLYLGRGAGEITPGPGDELEDAGNGNRLGDIVDAEPDPEGGFRFLAVANVQMKDSVQPRVRDSDSVVELIPLFT
ncbi:MAG: hypothetical protein MI673_03825 [Thiotrichales bacterium]|nr:hypothetical protein [Thiotrichales bacterium]